MSYIASDIKDMNRKIVYNLLLEKGESSKAEISRVTGISAPTVTKIIDFLIKIGCVREVGEGESAVGRKPNLLRFEPGAGYAIGVDISGVSMKVGIVDFGKKICYSDTIPTESDFKKVMNREFPIHIQRIIRKSGIDPQKIKGICIGVPGVVNADMNTIEQAPLVGIIDKEDCGEIFRPARELLNIPVLIENDANANALGEFVARGCGPDDDLLFITIGKGLGAGLILNGRLRKGPNCFAGELGYMVFDSQYHRVNSGGGWLETTLRLDDLWGELSDNPLHLETVAENLALAIVNICIPLEIHTVVLGRLNDRSFHNRLIERINQKIGYYSTIPILCEAPRSPEPGILGGANTIIDSVIDNMLQQQK